MIVLDTRCRDILMLLLESKTTLASGKIALQLNITPRMVRYSLPSVEKWLQGKDIRLIKKPGHGIFIDAPDQVKRDLIRELEYLTGYSLLLSPCERLHILIVCLMMNDQPLLAKQLESRLGVSRTTVLKDMDKAEKWLEEHHLSLVRRPHFGFQVVGGEDDWREAVVDFLLDTVGEVPLLALSCGSKL